MTSVGAIGAAANMTTDPNMNFHMGMLSSPRNSHVVSFQSGSIVSSPSMIFPVDRTAGMSCTSPGGMTSSPGMAQTGSSSGNLLLDQMAGLKADTGLAADWSYDEQLLLETGLRKYTSEPNMMKYIKIAASLRDKTVRDVALRCRWMTKKESGKRRKQEEYYIGKKLKDRKEKMVDASMLANMAACQPTQTGYSFTMPQMNHRNHYTCEVPVIDAATQCRIEENNILFHQIEDNLEVFKLQDNINLLSHSRNNINSILIGMRSTPGIMSQMPPLPEAINDELADAILPFVNQYHYTGSGSNRCSEYPEELAKERKKMPKKNAMGMCCRLFTRQAYAPTRPMSGSFFPSATSTYTE